MFGQSGIGGLSTKDSTNAAAGPSVTQVDGDETDADWLQLAKTNGEVYVRVSERVDLEGLPFECNLMAVSNTYGLAAVGGQSDIRIHRLEEIHRLLEDSPKDALPIAAPIHVLPLPARPVWVRLAMNEERLVVATLDGAGICVYRLRDILDGDTTPYHNFTSDIPSQLLNVLPNPAGPSTTDDLRQHAALLSSEGFIVADIEKRHVSSPIPGKFTCACWSVKGKQIVVGTKSGNFEQYTPEGTPKAKLPPPPELEENQYYPTSVQWLENDLFLASYARHDGTPQDNLEVFIIQRTKQSITYTKFFDVLDTMGLPERSGQHRFFVDLKQWGTTSKHLSFFASGLATEVGLMHGAADDEGTKWQLLFLDETARGVLPAAKKGVIQEDTSVLAMEVDLTATKSIVRGMEGGEELPDLPPPPRLLVYSQEGLLVSFNVQYPDAGPYPGMTRPKELPESSDSDVVPGVKAEAEVQKPTEVPTPIASTQVETPKPAFAGFGSVSSSTPSAFGASTTPNKSAFGSSGFGQTSTPSFGQATFSSTTPASTPAKPAFGQSGFGSTTPFSTPAAKPAFGQSGFGSSAPTSTSAAKPAFGGSAFGGFGSTTPSSTPAGKPAFGQSGFGAVASGGTIPAAKPTFGDTSIPAFGQSSTPTPSGFGSTTFGQSSKPAFGSSTFGQSTFGKPAQPANPPTSPASTGTAFGKPSTPSVTTTFGAPSSDTSTGNAGSAAKPSGTTGFGFAASSDNSSAFGQKVASPSEEKQKPVTSTSSTSSAFGKTTFGQSAFGSASSSGFGSSAFGKATAPPSTETKSVFGGFGVKSTPSPTGEVQSPFSGFGTKSSAAPASEAKSPFAGFGAITTTSPSPEAKSPFSGFGSTKPASSAVQEGSTFGGFGSQTKTPSADAKSPSAAFGAAPSESKSSAGPDSGQDGFGLGGFASMLGETTKTGTAPGLESPPASPPLGPTGKVTVPGLDDDTPPSSPPPKPSQATSTGSSAFIKPATGFSGAVTNSFGAFGQSSKPSAFGSSAKPAALSTPPSTTSPFGQASTSSGTAFGQTSRPGSTSTSAFGQASTSSGSAFGQSSKPGSATTTTFGQTSSPGGSAFGQSSKPLGFGQSSTPKAAGFGSISGGFGGFGSGASTGGFGGFAAKAPVQGQSIFGQKDDSTKPLGSNASSIFGQKKEEYTPVFGQKSVSETASIVEAPKVETPPSKAAEALTPEKKAEESVSVPPAVLPSGYDVSGPATAEVTTVKTPPVDVATASSVPLPPPDSPAPIRLPPADSPEVTSKIEDVSSSSSQEVLVEHEEVPPQSQERETAAEYDHDGESQDSYEQDGYDYEEEIEGEGQEDYDEDEEEYDEDEYDEEDGYEDEDYDEDAEEEVEEEEEGGEMLDRRSSVTVIPTEMSPIEEESPVEEDNEDGDEPSGKSGAKSPPAWFAKTSSAETSPLSIADQGGASASLFSRLGPAPTPATPTSSDTQSTTTATKTAPAFNLKHAVRTNSPLGQPPQMAFTSSEASPAKMATSFSFFGNAEKKPDDQKPLFGPGAKSAGFGLGLGKPSAPSAKSPVEEKPSFGGFGGFGQAASTIPAPVKEEPKSPFAGFGQSSVPAKPSAAPSLFAGFGQPSQTASKVDHSPQKTSTPPSLFSGFGQATPPKQAPSAVTAPVVKPAPPTTFTIPTRTIVPPAQQPRDDGKKTMGAVLERMVATLMADLDYLKVTLDANADYHTEFNIPEFVKIDKDNLDKHSDLPFTSLQDIRAIIDDLSGGVASKQSEQASVERKLGDLQSKLIKSDMKVGQADRFVKARNDPSFTKTMQLKDLSPEQAELQIRLREMIQSTEADLSEVEAGIASLKKQLEKKEASQRPGAPTLDKIQKTVRDVDAAIREGAATIEDLTERISSVRVSTPPRRREATPMPPATEKKPTLPDFFRATPEIVETIEKTTARQAKLKQQLLARKGAAVRVTRLDFDVEPKGELAHTALLNGPIKMKDVPLPGTTKIEIHKVKIGPEASSLAAGPSQPNPATSSQTPLFSVPPAPETPAAPSSSGMFGAIKFGALDPGPITPTSATARKSNMSGGSTRAHSAAPKFGGGSGLGTSPVSPGLSFVPPSAGDIKPSEGKNSPSGFFSLSSFGK